MCPFEHQWSATYPGEYSTMRTRMSPNWRVRHSAIPDSPGCRVGSIVAGPIIALGAGTALGQRGIFVVSAAVTVLGLLVVAIAKRVTGPVATAGQNHATASGR